MIDQSEWSMVARFLAGECTDDESARVRARMQSDREFALQVEEAESNWQAAEGQPFAWDTDSAWMRLAQRIRAETNRPNVLLHASRRPNVRVGNSNSQPPWVKIAAAAVFILAISGSIVGVGRLRDGSASRAQSPPLRTYTTVAGQRASVQLLDGTTVEMGPASSLRIRQFASDGRGPRIVELVGEAVFDVVHNDARPFLVYSQNAVTEDLGTTFSVKAYADDKIVRVVVAEGSVALRSSSAPGGSGTVLRVGDLAQLDHAGRVAVTSGIDADAYLGWTKGRIVFHDEPLGRVAVEVGRMFDANIKVTDKAISNRRVTVDMPNGTLSEVLDVLTVLLQINQSRDGQAYVLGPSLLR